MKRAGKILVCLIALFVLTGRGTDANALPAFPGAEGWGSDTIGGRGGAVCKVTRTADDTAAGSLRYCLTRTSPRIVVFETGGTITLGSSIKISSPYVTVAGQTAPGGGIQVRNGQITVDTHDVVIRGMKLRPGNQGSGAHALEVLENAYNVVIDHNSLQFGMDENTAQWGTAHHVTWSWNLIANALYNCSGCASDHNMGHIFQGPGNHITTHHNLYANNRDRNPFVAYDSNSCAVPTHAEVINNLVYNWQWGGAWTNVGNCSIVGNRFVSGPNTTNSYGVMVLKSECSGPLDLSVYVAHNIGPTRTTDSGDEWAIVQGGTSAKRTNTPPYALSNVNIESPAAIMDPILAGAGANASARDTLDAGIIANVVNRTGGYPSSPSWPTLAAGSAPADADNDGMPDAWERANGTNPDAADNNGDADGDGYTNIEEYINGFFSGSVDTPSPNKVPNPPSILGIY